MIAAAILCLALQTTPQVQFPDLRKTQEFSTGRHLKQIPPAVTTIDTQWVNVQGFVFLRKYGDEIREVLVTERMYARGVGAPPDVFTMLKVRFAEGAQPKRLTQGQPILLSGRFRIKKEGDLSKQGESLTGLFHLLEAIEGSVPDPEAKEVEETVEGLRSLNFDTLETARGLSKGNDIRVSNDVQKLHGKWVTLTGNVLISWAEEKITGFTLAKNPWDGCCLGKPTTPFDSVSVELKEGTTLQDRFSPVQTFSGRFEVDVVTKKGYVISLYKLMDAQEGSIPPPASEASGGGLSLGVIGVGILVLVVVGILIIVGAGRSARTS